MGLYGDIAMLAVHERRSDQPLEIGDVELLETDEEIRVELVACVDDLALLGEAADRFPERRRAIDGLFKIVAHRLFELVADRLREFAVGLQNSFGLQIQHPRDQIFETKTVSLGLLSGIERREAPRHLPCRDKRSFGRRERPAEVGHRE
jgi:hypothetical protein